MNEENSAISSVWDVNRRRGGWSNRSSFGQGTWSLPFNIRGHTLFIRRMPVEKQAKWLETIDGAAATEYTKDAKLVVTLGEICSDTGLLPNSVGSLQGLEKCGDLAVASGGTTDTWRGVLVNEQVALKAFRIYTPQDLLGAKKIIWGRVPIWKRLNHENVLSFHGVDTTIFELALVYDWGYNGNIIQYLEANPETSRTKLLLQVARGLRYLHSLEIIHGGLKGANVVISQDGTALLCDYGLTPINSNPLFTLAATPGVAGSSRWLAPELIEPPENPSKRITESKPADVFAFGMLAVEVFTGQVPFPALMNGSVVIQIVKGGRPAKPEAAERLGLTAEMWTFIKQCWSADPKKRPTMDEVATAWEGFASAANKPAPPLGIPERRSQFAESSDTRARKDVVLPPHKTQFCGLL